MITKNPSRRIAIKKCLNHAWFQKFDTDIKLVNLYNLNYLNFFQRIKKFKKAVINYVFKVKNINKSCNEYLKSFKALD